MAGGKFGTRGWLRTVELTLARVGLHAYWVAPTATALLPLGKWRAMVYDAVDAASDRVRSEAMLSQVSTRVYVGVKEWGVNPPGYSFSVGEEGRLGQHVPERYLDDRSDLKGTRLKMLTRMGCLPLMERVGREQSPKWPRAARVCLACNIGEVEDAAHFVLRCPAYARHRQRLFARVASVVSGLGEAKVTPVLASMRDCDRLSVILGKRVGHPVIEDMIDPSVKRYSRKAWSARRRQTGTINTVLNVSYEVFTSSVVRG